VSERGLSPVVGVVCLLAVTVLLAAVVVAAVPTGPPPEPTVATFDLDVDPGGEIRLTHAGGEPVEPGAIDLEIRVDGEPLAEPPPVPFFSANGFESAPEGAFNSALSGPWVAGETASLTLAGTNEPGIDAGDAVLVRVYVDGHRVAELETTA